MTALSRSIGDGRRRCTRAQRPLAIALLSLSMLASRRAYATPSAKLVYVRGTDAASCPDETMLRRAVATRIGYDPFFPSASKTVIAQVSRANGGYRGKVQIIGDDGMIRGERELATRGDDCAELISAMALAVSIALDDLDDGPKAPAPDATPAMPATPAAPAATTPAPASDAPSTAPDTAVVAPTSAGGAAPGSSAASVTASATTSRLAIAASLGATVSFGAAPGPSLGGGLGATLRYAWAAARFELRADLPAGADLVGGGRVSASSVLAAAAFCVRGDVPFVCAGGGVGSFASATSSIPRPASDSALLGELVATAGADVAITRQLFVEPFVDVGLVLTRHRVVVDGAEAYRLPALGGAAGIHLGWRFL